jgi:PKD repeat protein
MKSIKKSERKLFSLVFTVALICLMTAAIIPGVNGASTVNLGSAGNFSILTKAGITNVPTSAIIGDVGTSPITGASITGLGCPEVTGTIYTVNNAGPACRVINDTFLTAAVSAMESAYTDAAGRTLPNATELGAGNLGGMTLTPGLYKWSTGVLIPTSTDLTLDAMGNGSAVWIFQVAGDLTMATGSNVVLINGSKAENIFWQIGGGTGVTIEAGAHAAGNILALKAINMKGGASLNGRALAQTEVTLIANTISKPAGSGGPVANFSGTPTSGLAPRTVVFTDLSTNTPTLWSWTFGDGDVTNATAQNPVHTYLSGGNFTVSLMASNANGGNTMTKLGYINVTSGAPVANFTGTPTNGTAPLGVTFTDLSTGTGITNWSWNFGDGNITNFTVSSNPVHIYATAGLKSVNLTITNATGSISLNRTDYINVTFAPTVANFTGTPTSGTAPLGVTFTDLSTGTGITNWSWNFGDGNVTNFTVSTSPFHIYATAGLKSVNLTVTNATGSISLNRTDYINVTNGTPNSPGTNVGVFRNSSGNWYLDTTKTGVVSKIFQFGTTGDRPVVGDWDNNGITDAGVFRPSNGTWFLNTNQSSVINKTFHFGTTGDIPVVGDWDGNGIIDTGVFRPSNGNWFLDTNQSGVVNKTFHFGTTGDIPVVADWNHDGMDNVGVFRPSNGNWFLNTNQSSVVNKTFHFGTTGDTPKLGKWI